MKKNNNGYYGIRREAAEEVLKVFERKKERGEAGTTKRQIELLELSIVAIYGLPRKAAHEIVAAHLEINGIEVVE